MIADALTLEAQLRAQLDAESVQLQELARSVQTTGFSTGQFMASAEVNAGLNRFWQSVTWLDQNNRLRAHATAQSGKLNADASVSLDERGISSHLVAILYGPHSRSNNPITGSVVVRYSPTALLKRSVPWWLARKYEVRLIDGLEQEMANLETPLPGATVGKRVLERASYRVSFDPAIRDAYIELTEHDPFVPWYRTLPPTLMAGFLMLIMVATWMLRRQMQVVSRAEAAWRTEAAWRGAMEDSMIVGLRARNFDGRLVYVNRTFAQMVGWSQESLVGLIPPMPYWQPDEIEETMQRHLRNMAGAAPREGYEARWLHRDGHSLDVMVFETPLVDARGKQIGWMGSILDITERKRMEERDRKQADTLAHHARLTMLGEVASTLAHELNQPLTAIASYNAGVINSLHRDGFTDANVLTALQRLGEQAAQAGRIVQRIREFLTRREPEREVCEIHQLVVSAITLFRRELNRHNVTIKLNNDHRASSVIADAVLIEQVIINLLRNATDALAAQPEPSHEATTNRRIDVTINAPGARFLRVDVMDNGPGLAGRTIRDLCAAFYSTKADGMGMGLAICRSIIEAHEGVLDACEVPSSFAAHGAQFSFSLPLSIPPTEQTDRATSDARSVVA